MKKFSLLLTFLFLTLFFLPGALSKVYAGSLKFDKTTVSGKTNETFDVAIVVDAGSDQISSVDAYVLYDATLLEAQTASAAAFFPQFTKNITAGKTYIAGFDDDTSKSKTGTGTVATITFKALRDGAGNLTFDCQAAANNTSKIVKNDINATNVIVCAQNGQSAVTVGAGQVATPTSTASGTSSSTKPAELPRSGVFENIRALAVPGMVLLILGTAVKLLL